MKKLLFLLMMVMTLLSCNTPTVIKTDIPNEIVSLKENKRFDTTLTITTDMRVYIFSKQGEYQGSYVKHNASPLLSIIIGVLLVVIFAVIYYRN